ncbi:MAG: HAD-IIB family hydrolase [Lentisphaeraceae bacterium]|nr:HAD-IIB family hydrolase [Lentisphaeraceae bacterium]
MKKIILYTDLDGTLLDHHNYSWESASKAISLLKESGFPIVFNTSKTINEVRKLQKEMSLTTPFAIENGGAVWIPENYFSGATGGLVVLGIDNQTILNRIESLRKNYKFKSFCQMDVSEIAELTGLSEQDAIYASQRTCSEPLIWLDTDEQLESFKEMVRSLDLQFVKGGRFYHLSGHSNKGNALNYLHQFYKKDFPNQNCVSVALGDSQNDESMLKAADISVLIQKADGSYLECSGEHIRKSSDIGPKGWNSAVIDIIDEINRGVKQ